MPYLNPYQEQIAPWNEEMYEPGEDIEATAYYTTSKDDEDIKTDTVKVASDDDDVCKNVISELKRKHSDFYELIDYEF